MKFFCDSSVVIDAATYKLIFYLPFLLKLSSLKNLMTRHAYNQDRLYITS